MNVLFADLSVYDCFRCRQIWCKFRTEIPTGKYLKMVGSKWTPCAQTGVKNSLGTEVLNTSDHNDYKENVRTKTNVNLNAMILTTENELISKGNAFCLSDSFSTWASSACVR